jgi:predicted transposase YdaD
MNTFDRLAIETGLAAKWEAEGEARGEAKGEVRGTEKVARNLAKLGIPAETIITATQLDPEKVKALYQ